MKLNQITIPSLDVEKAIEFYELLDFKLIVKSIPNYVRFICPDQENTFSIHKVEKLSNIEGIWIYFECENLDQQVQELISKGVIFEELPIDQVWLWREARLRDLDNNLIILYSAGENRLNPPWKI